MTLQSERIKESHRGWLKAEPASRSRIAALESFGLQYARVDDFNVIVEGTYQLNLAMSYWRALDGSAHGYLVSALEADIKRQRQTGIDLLDAMVPADTELFVIDTFNSEKPAGGRDSAAPPLQALSSVASYPADDAVAESPAGSPSSSASLLPVVSP